MTTNTIPRTTRVEYTGGDSWLTGANKSIATFIVTATFLTNLPPNSNYIIPNSGSLIELKNSDSIQKHINPYEFPATNVMKAMEEHSKVDIRAVSNILELSNKLLSHTKPLGGKMRDLMDIALLASGTKYPTVKGMK